MVMRTIAYLVIKIIQHIREHSTHIIVVNYIDIRTWLNKLIFWML